VTRVLLERGRAVGVEGNALFVDRATDEPVPDPTAPGGVRIRRIVVRARQVVVAAGALRSPVILERSGLAHPGIGRHLRLHPVPVVAARMAMPVDMWLGPMQGARSLEFAAAEGGRNGYAIESAPGHPGLLALALPWEGNEEHAAVMRDARFVAPLLAVTQDGGAGRVRARRAGHVRVDYRLDATGIATLRHALVRMARLARAAGAVEILAAATPPVWYRPARSGVGEASAFARFEEALAAIDPGPNRVSIFSAHQMGTVRMGAAPREHPCDPAGRVRVGPRRDRVVGGLYVADASLFPTGLGVNPMLTVMALARRVARTVLAEA
jgi:choline dehydrogenase-like flavoprotein